MLGVHQQIESFVSWSASVTLRLAFSYAGRKLLPLSSVCAPRQRLQPLSLLLPSPILLCAVRSKSLSPSDTGTLHLLWSCCSRWSFGICMKKGASGALIKCVEVSGEVRKSVKFGSLRGLESIQIAEIDLKMAETEYCAKSGFVRYPWGLGFALVLFTFHHQVPNLDELVEG